MAIRSVCTVSVLTRIKLDIRVMPYVNAFFHGEFSFSLSIQDWSYFQDEQHEVYELHAKMILVHDNSKNQSPTLTVFKVSDVWSVTNIDVEYTICTQNRLLCTSKTVQHMKLVLWKTDLPEISCFIFDLVDQNRIWLSKLWRSESWWTD